MEEIHEPAWGCRKTRNNTIWKRKLKIEIDIFGGDDAM